MRYLAGVIVWFSIIGFIVIDFVLAAYFYKQSKTYNDNKDTTNYDFTFCMAIILFV